MDPDFSWSFRNLLSKVRDGGESRLFVPIFAAAIGCCAAQAHKPAKFIQNIVFTSQFNGFMAFAAL
jgi:hypothetical protein